uniref:Uncharacterized protein n=1 Tax=Panagrolaimus sp. PS1159 TaxID=55785 RepID=A0AC35GGJ1_9BILA
MLLLIFANTKKKSVMKKVEILFGCVIIINFFMALLFGISGKLVWDKSVVDSTSKEDGYNLYSLSRSAFVCAQIIFLLTCYMLLTFAFVDKARRRKPEFSFPVPTYPINNNNQIYVPKMEPHNPASTHDSKVDSTPMAV